MLTSSTSSIPTVRSFLERAGERLEREGSRSPRLDAEVLLGHVLERERTWLYAHGEGLVPEAAGRKFESLVGRRCEGCPVAYLTGAKEFWSLEFAVSPAVLIPRPETEHVVEEALGEIGGLGGAVWVWDVGTGCGNIAVALAASEERVRVLASELSPAALVVAQGNVRRLGVADRVFLLAADLDEPIGFGRFHLIVSNPPYVPTGQWPYLPRGVRDFEPAEALCAGSDGLSMIGRLVNMAPVRLRRGGSLVFEIGESMGSAVRELIGRTKGLELVRISKDYAGRDRVVVARVAYVA